MATLRDYFENDRNKLAAFKHIHNLTEFIETGTGYGETIGFVKDVFNRVYSFEINSEIYNSVASKFITNRGIRIYNCDSESGLKDLFLFYNFPNPIFFFLDAHFPGADFGLAGYEDETNKSIRLPLQRELELIVMLRREKIKADVLIIDDLRLYEDGPFEAGPWELIKHLGGNGIEFVYDLFAETHYIEKDYRFQGFLLLTPMK